jgi:SAM-dependent methyltransferase
MANPITRPFRLARGFYRLARDRLRRRSQEDEFTRWLRYANAGMLEPGNVWCMDFAIRNLPSADPMVEIGSFAGLSANVICHLLRKHSRGNKFFTCDNWDVTGEELAGCIPGSDIGFPRYAQYVKASYQRNIEFFSPGNRPHTIEASSTDFFGKWSRNEEAVDVFGRTVRLGGPISFCYVDALHSCDAVRKEFESIDRYLVPGGFILFDDSSDSGPFDVNRLMPEIARNKRYELVQQCPNYLFRKR